MRLKSLEALSDVITVKQLAGVLQVSETTIKRALKSGALKGFKVGSDWRIAKDNVYIWLIEHNEPINADDI